MAWTASRVERVLEGIAALHNRNDTERMAHLQRENDRLTKELSEMERVHKAAVKDLSEKGTKMEHLMRQLLAERSRLMEELAQMREAKTLDGKEMNLTASLTDTLLKSEMAVQTDALRPHDPPRERTTQTVRELEEVAVQTDALRLHDPPRERTTQTVRELEEVAVQTDALRPHDPPRERTTQTVRELEEVAVQTDALRPHGPPRERTTQTVRELEEVAVQTDALRLHDPPRERTTQTVRELEEVAVQTDALRPHDPPRERTTQTVRELEEVAVQTDALRLHDPPRERTTQTVRELEEVAVQTDALRPHGPPRERTTQTVRELEEVAVQTDALRLHDPPRERTTQNSWKKDFNLPMRSIYFAKAMGQTSAFLNAKAFPVKYVYGLLTPISVHFIHGAECLALAIYFIGQWVENVKLDIPTADFVFVGVNVQGWWQWRRQALIHLDAVTDIVRAYSDAADPLWWCAALAAVLLDLDMDHNMSVGDFIAAGCGGDVGTQTPCTPVSLNEMIAFLKMSPKSCVLVTKKNSDFGDTFGLLMAVSVLENEALFYIVRPSGSAGGDEGTTGDSSICTLKGEWRSGRELLSEFDLFQTVRCFSSYTNPEIRWVDAVQGHFTSVSVLLPEGVLVTRDAIYARLFDVTTSLWWPVEVISREGNTLMFFSPFLESATSVIVLLNVDVDTVCRLEFLQIVSEEFGIFRRKTAVVVQVDGQEVCTSSLTLNAAVGQEPALREGIASISAHFGEPDPITDTEYSMKEIRAIDVRRNQSSTAADEARSQNLVVSIEADAIFRMVNETLAVHMELMVNYMDRFLELLSFSLWSQPPRLDERGGAVVLSPMLATTIARQHVELSAMRARKDFLCESLCCAAKELNSTKTKLNCLEEENGVLREELVQQASACELLRQDIVAKDEKLAGAARYCCAVEEQLRLAMDSFLELRCCAEKMQ
ncbi:hypothetical protein TcYC6_0022020 [Trypanosoma cruzi]|nr:hypothetical protein TcYC6_0022020 [Trypanosoma cruzi]